MFLHWRLFSNSKKQDVLDHVISEMKNRLDGIEVTKCELYWKDDALYEIEMRQPLNLQSPELFLLALTKYISTISNFWSLTIPNDIENYYSNIEGICEKSIKINSVVWVSFLIY